MNNMYLKIEITKYNVVTTKVIMHLRRQYYSEYQTSRTKSKQINIQINDLDSQTRVLFI